MSNSTTKAILYTQSKGETEVIVPQLEYFNPSFRSAGIPPIQFGNLFRQQKGREPRAGETVRFVFQEIKYRGAFGWYGYGAFNHNGQTLPVIGKPRASFMLGAGWLPGQMPKQMELLIPAGAMLMGASGLSKREMTSTGSTTWGTGVGALPIHNVNFTIDQVPSCIFSFQGTEAFITPSNPLIFNHHGKIFAGGGTGMQQFTNQSLLIANTGGIYQAAGGNGKGWPTCVWPLEDIGTKDIYEESVTDSVLNHTRPTNALNRPNGGKPYIMTQEKNPSPSQYMHCSIWLGGGGSWGRMGEGVLFVKTVNNNGSFKSSRYNPPKGGLPGSVFDLANFVGSPDIYAEAVGSVTTGTRFPNWATLSSCIDFSAATGEINLGTPAEWKTAPAIDGAAGTGPNNLSWSWRQAMYRDCWGLTTSKLFGSTYDPIEGYGVAPLSYAGDYGLVDPYRP